MFTLKLRPVGTSTGTVFPKEMLAIMRLSATDTVYVTEAPDGSFRLTPYNPVFAAQMAMAEEIMREDRDILPHGNSAANGAVYNRRLWRQCSDIVYTTADDSMKVLVKKWGNSASVRIPASVLAAAHIRLDQAVDVREEQGRIVIEPIRPLVYDLDKLIDGITPENRHDEVDFGKPMGKEAW